MTESSKNQIVEPGSLAIGTAPLGGLYTEVSDRDASATLHAAAAGGVTHFDTAPHYGRGLAEKRLGAFLTSIDDPARFTVSTKVGRSVRATDRRHDDDIFTGASPGESVFDFSPRGIRAQLDASRDRLRRDRIEMVFLHDPDDHLDGAVRAAEELAGMKDAGHIGAFGVGTNSARVVDHLLDRVDLDAVLLAGRITLLESSGETVARRCADRGVALLAAGVFQSGILAGSDSDAYDYLPAPTLIRQRVARLSAVCERFDVPLRTVAITYARRIHGVTTTLVGVRSPAEATAAVGDFTVTLPEELWRSIDAVRDAWNSNDSERNQGTQQ